jgi:general secretion pathway protein N
MTQPRYLLFAAAATFAASTIGTFPAGATLQWFTPEEITATGLSGTLWRGNATLLVIGGIRCTDTHWQLNPLDLLRGRLGGHVDTQIANGTASGTIALGPSGVFICEGCTIQGDAAALRSWVPALQAVEGRFELTIDRLEVRKSWPARAVGTARIGGVVLEPGGRNAATATFEASFNQDPVAQDGVVSALVRDAAGPVELNGQLTLQPPGQFEFSARVRPRPDASTEIASALRLLGAPAADGSIELRASGSL